MTVRERKEKTMIQSVEKSELMQAAFIHSESWKESHRGVCSEEFIAQHTPERQKQYLESAVEQGARLYMLTAGKPVGIVSVRGSLIENLYVLPDEQNRGYGTQLLLFAVRQCADTPTLWILSTNERARRLYERHGFRPTGNIIRHQGGVSEQEFRLIQGAERK